MTRLSGKENLVPEKQGATEFSDVGETHWASGYINIVTILGVMSGYDDGTFKPDGKVNMLEALTDLINILGYSITVGPFGILDRANEIGITADVDLLSFDLVSRGAFAKLIANSLDVPLMKKTGFGAYEDYIIQDGIVDSPYKKTILSEKFGIVKYRATVDEMLELNNTKKVGIIKTTVLNSYNSKYGVDYGNVFYRNSIVDINKGNTNLLSFVGLSAIIYAKYDENSVYEPLAVFVKKDSAKTEEVTFTSDNFADAYDGYNGIITVEYYPTDTATRTERLTIDNSANVYINGQKTNWLVIDALRSFYGSVTFLLQNQNSFGDFDTVFITNYVNTVVHSVNTVTGKVTVKAGASISFSETSDQTSAKLYDTDGNEIDWRTLKENDVLSTRVIKGDSKTIYMATLVRNAVNGMIIETCGDPYNIRDAEFTIGEKRYNVDGQITYPEDLALEDEGSFYLDIMGKITYFDMDYNPNYAYVISVEEYGTIDRKTQITMFTSDGIVATWDTTSRVKASYTDYNGYYVTEAINSYALTNYLQPNSFITYETCEVDSSVYINKITFPDKSQEGCIDSRTFNMYASAEIASFDYNGCYFNIGGRKSFVTDKTLIMVAPKVDITGGYDEGDYQIVPLSRLNDDYMFGFVSAYDVNLDNEAGCILIESAVDLTSGKDGMAMVISSETVENDLGDLVSKLSVLQKSINENENSELFADDCWLDIPNMGSAIIPSLNSKGVVIGYKEIAVLTEDGLIKGSDFDYINGANNVWLTIGEIEGKNSNRITTKSGDYITVPQSANVYVYDERFRTVTMGDINCFDVSNGHIYKDGDVESASMLVYEYDGVIVDVALYFFGDAPILSETEVNLCVAPQLAAANAVYYNNSDAAINPLLIIARYKDGKLTELAKTQTEISANDFGKFKCMMTSDFENGETVKAMLVDSFDTLEPLRCIVSSVVDVADFENGENAVSFKFDEFDSIVYSGDLVIVKYSDSEITTINNPNVYINGISADNFKFSALSDYYGEIIFADKDINNVYRTIYITDYTNTIVDYVNTTTERVLAKQGNSISFGDNDINSFALLFDEAGNKLDWSALNELDVLSTKVINHNNINIYISTLIQNNVAGIITEILSDYNNNTVFCINGDIYKVDSKTTYATDFKIVDEGDFYLDILGRIAYFNRKSLISSNYAYVIAADTINSNAQVKLFAYEGSTRVYNISSSVRISYTNTDVDSIYAIGEYVSTSIYSNEFFDSTKDYYLTPNSFIKFGVNSSGYINRIEFPDKSKEGIMSSGTFNKFAYADYASYDYNRSCVYIGGKKTIVTESTVIMIAPKVEGVYYDEEDYEIISFSRLVDNYDYWPYVSAYDINRDGEAGCILIESAVDLTSGADGIAMVVASATAKNEDGDTVSKITVLHNSNFENNFANSILDTTEQLSNLTLGTVIIPTLNAKGIMTGYSEVAKIDRDYYYGNTALKGYSYDDVNGRNNVKLIFGEVVMKEANRITTASNDYIIIPSSANVYVYNPRGGTSFTKVMAPEERFDVFVVDKRNGTIYDTYDEDIIYEKVQILVREYNNIVEDVVFYLF